MKGIYLHSGNDLERLADAFVAELDKSLPGNDPFIRPTVVVQSPGIRRWLTLWLACKQGVCANIDFQLLWEFMEELPLGNLPKAARFNDCWQPEALTWRLLGLLNQCRDTSGFESLSRYLGAKANRLKQYHLARRLAFLFSQYLVYRPDMLEQWRRGAQDDWQAGLWRRLVEHIGGPTPADLRKNFDAREPPRNKAVFLFGLTMLPPAFVDVLRRCAEVVPIHLFSVRPTEHDWSDLLGAREQWRIHSETGNWNPGELHFADGHPLLVSMARPAKEFDNILRGEGDILAGELENHHPPKGDTLLARLQRGIYEVDLPDAKQPVPADDSSIQVHSCHGPMREVEVLHDLLLDWFESDPTLQPGEVAVLSPSIEKYAPFVRAVFGQQETGPGAIPYSIADRSPRASEPTVNVFLKLLDIRDSALTAMEVLDLLEAGPVRRKYGISAADLERLYLFCQSAEVRWGFDEHHRESMELPAVRENTWQAGLDRMLLGAAMLGEPDQLFAGILPDQGLEGQSAEPLGGLYELLDNLERIRTESAKHRTLAEWGAWLGRLQSDFFDLDGEEEKRVNAVDQAIDGLGKMARNSAGFDGTTPIEAIREHLIAVLDTAPGSAGFLRGRVTFCELKPLRSVPFRVICLLGMNDGEFPRRDPVDPLNRMLEKGARREGDRSGRADDRYLFLETLLSTRQKLGIFYQGQSMTDETDSPPSVVVSELLDALDQTFTFPDGADARGHLVTRHRMQAFSPAYFDDSEGKLFSYSKASVEAARLMRNRQWEQPPFLEEPLPEPDDTKLVALDDLLRFFSNPARYFLRQRMRIFLDERADLLEDAEVFSLDGLEQYRVKDRLLSLCLADSSKSVEDIESLRVVLRAEGGLPHASAGEAAFNGLRLQVEDFARQIKDRLPGGEPFKFEERFGEFTLRGELDGICGNGQTLYRCSRINNRDLIKGWIRHLALNHLRVGEEQGQETQLFGMDRGKVSKKAFSPLEDAGKLLHRFLKLYWQGLSEPLPLFVNSSATFVERTLKNQKAIRKNPNVTCQDPLEQALVEWEGSQFKAGERQDPSMALCFRNQTPETLPRFESLALKVWAGLYSNLLNL